MKRILSALIGFPLIIAVLIFSNIYIIDIIFSLIAIIAIKEYFNAFSKKANPIKWIRLFVLLINSFYSYYSN